MWQQPSVLWQTPVSGSSGPSVWDSPGSPAPPWESPLRGLGRVARAACWGWGGRWEEIQGMTVHIHLPGPSPHPEKSYQKWASCLIFRSLPLWLWEDLTTVLFWASTLFREHTLAWKDLSQCWLWMCVEVNWGNHIKKKKQKHLVIFLGIWPHSNKCWVSL